MAQLERIEQRSISIDPGWKIQKRSRERERERGDREGIETLTDYVDSDRVVDRSLGIAGYARVPTLVLLENSIEMKSSIDILHVLGEFFA